VVAVVVSVAGVPSGLVAAGLGPVVVCALQRATGTVTAGPPFSWNVSVAAAGGVVAATLTVNPQEAPGASDAGQPSMLAR
jgi:hypothetical protein